MQKRVNEIFSADQQQLFMWWFEEGYDLSTDPAYNRWLKKYHSESSTMDWPLFLDDFELVTSRYNFRLYEGIFTYWAIESSIYSETNGEVSEQSVDPLAELATSNDMMHPDDNRDATTSIPSSLGKRSLSDIATSWMYIIGHTNCWFRKPFAKS